MHCDARNLDTQSGETIISPRAICVDSLTRPGRIRNGHSGISMLLTING